ncbi:MAG: hypothetical protein M1822_008470 [Bathelium mastoideum]|nr:MAG: hypothetical protein M1822_008470 [Bathelium mastoideum]
MIVDKMEPATRLRTYQDEMLEESLQRNVVVAMDTGSGKTLVAIARIAAELERSSVQQRVWFLAPTVALCQQQAAAIRAHLPAYQTKVLTGQDGVELWTEQELWDAALLNVSVVVSTHAVLRDALTHGFVGMEGLALLVFDEAHHCSGKHPANQIMQNFYFPLYGADPEAVPHILGLSASPVVRANAKGLDVIEANLNARVITPKRYRSVLMEHVHPPSLEKSVYSENLSSVPSALHALENVRCNMDPRMDPFVKEFLQSDDVDSQVYGQKLLLGTKKTFCAEQVSTFCHSSNYIYEELGGWAADWYIWNCLQNFGELIELNEDIMSEWTKAEKLYLVELLGKVQPYVQNPYEVAEIKVSSKAQHLIDLLAAESSPNFRGLVFVKQRVTVAALAELLSIHPKVRGRYNLGTFVGTSMSSKRKFRFADRINLREQQQSLDEFRTGVKNLILGTSVLEEGIDIAACNTVICYEAPENLKSYVQRRGRARMAESRYVIFASESDVRNKPEKFNALEEDMRRAYMDELRKIQALSELEDSEKDDGRTFRITQTGALLTLDNALPHLTHFCAKVVSGVHVDPRPQFTKVEEDLSAETFRIKVILPPTLEPQLRVATSLKVWKSEKNAKKDAAFEVYLNLYRAGLISDNLLPLEIMDPDAPPMNWTDDGPSLVSASELLNPWKLAVSRQEDTHVWHAHLVTVSYSKSESEKMLLLLPDSAGDPADICLYWNETVCYSARLESLQTLEVSPVDLMVAREFTKLLLFSVFGTRMNSTKDDFVALFRPAEIHERPFQEIVKGFQGQKSVLECQSIEPTQMGIIRESSCPGRSLLFHSFETEDSRPSHDLKDAAGEHEVMVKFMKLPKRRDFLHPLKQQEPLNESYTTIHTSPASTCTMDNLPVRYSIFALFIPSILHRCGLFILAKDICQSLLHPLNIGDPKLVQLALTASSTQEEEGDYQRLEFLGDALLKYHTAIRVFYEHPEYPESYLSAEKSRRVANATIAKAALEKGLDKYIIRIPFTGHKWLPSYREDVVKYEETRAKMSRKIVADVVEALIGASYVDGGWSKAQACIDLFMPSNGPAPNAENITTSPSVTGDTPNLSRLENLIGYTFTNKNILLEAVTHASYTGDAHARCYDRLEFLGDAVLDYIITPRLYHHRRADGSTLSHHRMHSIRTAVVNADFLAFCCLTYSLSETSFQVVRDPNEPLGFAKLQETKEFCLWQWMRLSNVGITRTQQAALRRYEQLREEIAAGLERGDEYPWAPLLRLQAEKFFSDLVESVIGAIFMDSRHDLAPCERFVERLGVLGALDRILRDEVQVIHPKERVGIFAGNKKVKYTMEMREGLHHCTLKIGDEVVSTAEGALAEVARTAAAAIAVRSFKTM